MTALTNSGNVVVEQVRTKARTAGAGVYPLANIPAPATPGPRPAPGKPTDFVATLDESGALALRWKCPNPAGSGGTIYQIYRRTTPAGEFAYLGGSGTKAFVDTTLPAGSAAVTYQLQAVRSTGTGPWAQFNVNFGTGTGGGTMMTTSVVEGTPTKIAA